MPTRYRHALRLLLVAGSLAGLLIVLSSTASAGPLAQSGTPTPGPVAIIAVERAPLFPVPDRNAVPVTYLYEREQVAVLGRTADNVFLRVTAGSSGGWLLLAQVELAGDAALLPVFVETTPVPGATRTPLPTRTPRPTIDPASGTPTPVSDLPPVVPGTPPPLTITLPEGWKSLHLIVPFITFDNTQRDIPLSIYFGPLPGDITAYIYLYWGFPSTVDYITGEYTPWADGMQLLRGSLVGDTCNLGVYGQQNFRVGDREGIGAFYQAAECEGATDTAGWFISLRVQDGTYAFYTAVEPWDRLSEQRLALQTVLDSVVFQAPAAP